MPRDLKDFVQAANGPLRRHASPLARAAIRDYFRELFWTKGEAKLDAATLDGQPFPILTDIAERANGARYRFASIARAFRLIEDAMAPVAVPWSAGPEDGEAEDLLRRIAAMGPPESHRPARAAALRRADPAAGPVRLARGGRPAAGA